MASYIDAGCYVVAIYSHTLKIIEFIRSVVVIADYLFDAGEVSAFDLYEFAPDCMEIIVEFAVFGND